MDNMDAKKRNTIILLSIIVLISLLLLAVQKLHSGSMAGRTVAVSVDGRETAAYDLYDEVDVVISGYQGGSNHLVIRGGEAVITEADCPDGICTHMGPITEPGDSMVCLPHRVAVTIR